MKRDFIPYSTQTISSADIQAVVDVLQSGWLTGGNAVERFEEAVASYCNVPYTAALSSGTAALHAAVHCLSLVPGDEVIVSPLSFIATANAILYEGARPVFCDIMADSLLIDPASVERLISPRTKAVIAVDYAGQLCDFATLSSLCTKHGLTLIADACHSLGAESVTGKSGQLADITVFSFHPVKQITTGEGGMVTSFSDDIINRVKSFRNHGMDLTPKQRQQSGVYGYRISQLGYNYRLTDIQSALGYSQLGQLDQFIRVRRNIASYYDSCFKNIPDIVPLSCIDKKAHAYHLYVVKVPQRDAVFQYMRQKNIGVNVHYLPIHLHELYRKRLQTKLGLCPVAEECYQSILSLPIFPQLIREDQDFVIEQLFNAVNAL